MNGLNLITNKITDLSREERKWFCYEKFPLYAKEWAKNLPNNLLKTIRI